MAKLPYKRLRASWVGAASRAWWKGLGHAMGVYLGREQEKRRDNLVGQEFAYDAMQLVDDFGGPDAQQAWSMGFTEGWRSTGAFPFWE